MGVCVCVCVFGCVWVGVPSKMGFATNGQKVGLKNLSTLNRDTAPSSGAEKKVRLANVQIKKTQFI